MISLILVITVALLISFLGSIPPGSINITVMQLSMQGRHRTALFFVLGASLVEMIYVIGTVKFQLFLSTQDVIYLYFRYFTAGLLIVLGIYNLLMNHPSTKNLSPTDMRGRTGFQRGVLLGLLNPLTIPFWLAVTTYLQDQAWFSLEKLNFWGYIFGLTVGTFLLLVLVMRLGKNFEKIATNDWLIHKIPGLIFLLMGAFYWWQLLY